jgi:hypothetical protein
MNLRRSGTDGFTQVTWNVFAHGVATGITEVAQAEIGPWAPGTLLQKHGLPREDTLLAARTRTIDEGPLSLRYP